MPELEVQIANCLLGTERRDCIELSLSGFRFTLRQTPAGTFFGPIREKVGNTLHTTTLEFGEVSQRARRRAESVANDVSWLLRFATMSPVAPFSFRFGRDTRRENISGEVRFFRPPIETRNGNDVRTFIETTWAGYRRLKRQRKLKHVIHYLGLADAPEQPIEVRTLLAFTALECLKSTHSPGRRGDFRARLARMFAAVGMRPGLACLARLRNSLVHEGIAGVPYNSLRDHYERLQDLHQEYILRLLGFRGNFHPYSSRATRWKKI